MIKSISDLLKSFVSAEIDILNDYDIKHPTTIGSMYEGLTEEILNKSIFDNLDLKIVKNSFIKGCNIEFDVMLVEGEGEKIPHTDRFKYSPEKVLVIIQCKKNLYSKDIEDSHDNLKTLIDHYKLEMAEKYTVKLFNDSFRLICRKETAAQKLGELSLEEEYVYNSLMIDALLPIRIVWGYNGFKSELNFRESFVNNINKNLTVDFENRIGYFGPHNFANLIICGDYSMIKQNGIPFAIPMDKDRWQVLTTSSYNPTYFFLELIWTKLSYKYDLPTEIFGDDLSLEPVNYFLNCRIKRINDNYGWELNYSEQDDEMLKSNTIVNEWQPVEVDEIQSVVINQIGRLGEIELDNELENYVKTGNYNNLNEFIESLVKIGIATVLDNKLILLTDECAIVHLPDGRTVAGDNKSGRLKNWVSKYLRERKN